MISRLCEWIVLRIPVGSRACKLHSGAAQYRTKTKRFALAGRPCKKSVVPGKNPSSGAFDEAQAGSCKTTVVAECNVGSCPRGHPRKGPCASRRRPGARRADEAPPLR